MTLPSNDDEPLTEVNDESVEAELHGAPLRFGERANLVDLLLDALDRIAVEEIPVRMLGRHPPRRLGIPALKDFGMRRRNRPGFQPAFVDAVEVTLES